MTKNNEKKSVYEEITERIINSLEAGVIPWTRPWETARYGEQRNAVTDRSYRGVNIMLLNLVANMKGFVDTRWMTFRNAEKLGGHVKKGEKGTGIVFWQFLKAMEQKGSSAVDSEDAKQKMVPFVRMYTVFNVEQCENIELSPLKITVGPEGTKNLEAEKIISLPNLKYGGSRAYYSQSKDHIVLPVREAFENLDFYFSTAYHEILHWSGHPSRLNRKLGIRFGDQDYAFEELVAEIGAAFLGAGTGIPFEGMRHPEYLNFWLQILKKDNRAIFTAAAKAQAAADFVLDKVGLSVIENEQMPAAA
ncbi:MAG: zincin-like metallopeptidase domain-containing protein [Deltaproteobacteria bacterium]|nr:zincin-like metallopeptidase domain-containing protein [Deltaproteobacteria bacterium]